MNPVLEQAKRHARYRMKMKAWIRKKEMGRKCRGDDINNY